MFLVKHSFNHLIINFKLLITIFYYLINFDGLEKIILISKLL